MGAKVSLPGEEFLIFIPYLTVEQTVNEEDESPLQTVDNGEQVCHDACQGANLENAQHPGAAQDENLGNGLEGQQPRVLEFRDFWADTAELLPQNPQCPGKEDRVYRDDHADRPQETPDKPRLCIQPAA